MCVVASWALKPARSVPEAFAMLSRAAVVFASLPCISAIVSYQAPTSALPSFGLAFSTSLLTIMRSRISPGVLLESNTSVVFGTAVISDNSGFQVTTEVTVGAANAPTMSASDVFTTLMSRSARPTVSSARASR
jgi:hypothetical protein